jgi:hypothetical protein
VTHSAEVERTSIQGSRNIDNSTIYGWTGIFGLAVFVFTPLELPLCIAGGEAPAFQDAAQSSEFVANSIGATADPSVLRGLTESYFLIYGPAGRGLIALTSIAAGLATLGTSALPKWSGRVAVIVGILNILMIPSMFGGCDPREYRSAGWGVAVTGTFP